MKSIVILIAFVVASTTIFASGGNENPKTESSSTFELSGYIIDEISGEALVGVAVRIGSQTTYTDFEGQFKIENLSLAQVTLKTSYVAYEDKEMEINPDSKSELRIALKEK